MLLYYILVKPLSLLPFAALYRISNGLFVILYKWAGYRKKVVRQNIERSFPNKSASELRAIESDFYKHFCDFLVEVLKGFSTDYKEVQNRFILENPEVLEPFYQQGKTVILVGGHTGNWEGYAFTLPHSMKHRPLVPYTPLSNKFFDKKVRKSRTREQLLVVDRDEVSTFIGAVQEAREEPLAVFMLGDQAPRRVKNAIWTDFLNQDTPVMAGTEVLARKFDLPVVYFGIRKVARGYYMCRLELLTDNVSAMEFGELTKLHTAKLEQTILNQPHTWLWTHRRWKRTRADLNKA